MLLFLYFIFTYIVYNNAYTIESRNPNHLIYHTNEKYTSFKLIEQGPEHLKKVYWLPTFIRFNAWYLVFRVNDVKCAVKWIQPFQCICARQPRHNSTDD